MTPQETTDAILRIEAKIDDLIRLMTLGDYDDDADDDLPAFDISGQARAPKRDPDTPL